MIAAALALVLVVALGFMTVPIPVWASRALRSAPPRPALPPAATTTVPVGGRPGAVLRTEVNTAIDLVGRARESLADYAAAWFMVWLLDRGARDNWVKALVLRAQHDEAEAGQAIGRVVEAIGTLPPEDRQRFEHARDALGSVLLAAAAAVDQELVPGRVVTRAEARRTVAMFEQALAQLLALRGEMLGERRDPYR